jgi:predicted dehydrogenase
MGQSEQNRGAAIRKVLIFGLGSIGCRHAEVLLAMGGCAVAACRTGRGGKDVPEALAERITMFADAEAAFAWRPDHAIISNPTILHPARTAASLDRGIDVLVEKPVGAELRDVEQLEGKVRPGGPRAYVGYNLRFHPIVEAVKAAIDSGTYGRVLKADLYAGHWLPHWHRYEDYRTGYAARKDLGGGVLRTLSHEVDLGQYWFGEYVHVLARVAKVSDLEIDVDDTAEIVAETQRCGVLKISLDYLRPAYRRGGELFFEGGLLAYDFTRMKVELTDYDSGETRTLAAVGGYDCNESYRRQMEAFLARSDDRICTLKEGIEVMRVIDACEQSSVRREVMHVQA